MIIGEPQINDEALCSLLIARAQGLAVRNSSPNRKFATGEIRGFAPRVTEPDS
jgi:hypothetical protein